jgi:hypothetical protein
MSYAEEYFGVREMEALTLADNLAWFGVDSYVYKSQDLMNKVIDSTQTRLNPIVNLYIYLYSRDNGLDVDANCPLFTQIGVYNKDFGETFNFSRIQKLSDGSSLFVMSSPLFFCGHFDSTGETYPATDVLQYSDYTLTRWANSDNVNLVQEWSDMPASQKNSPKPYVQNALKNIPGFLHGITGEVKDRLVLQGSLLCSPMTESTSKTLVSLSGNDSYVDKIKALVKTTDKTKSRTTKYILPFVKNYASDGVVTSYTNVLAAENGQRSCYIPIYGVSASDITETGLAGKTKRGTFRTNSSTTSNGIAFFKIPDDDAAQLDTSYGAEPIILQIRF